MTPTPPPSQSSVVARQAREHFVAQLEGVLQPLSDAIRARLLELMDTAAGSREAQDRRDAMLDFEHQRHAWVDATASAWRKAVAPPTATARVRLEALDLALMGDDVVENKILASRLALAVLEKATWELNEIKVRMEHLDGQELASHDVLRAEAVAQLMVEQWGASGLPRPTWVQVHELIHKHMIERMQAAYRSTNELLVARGVLPDIDLSARVRRGAPAPTSRPAPASGGSAGHGAAGGGSGGGGSGGDARPGGGAGAVRGAAGAGGGGGFSGGMAGGRPGGGGGGGFGVASGDAAASGAAGYAGTGEAADGGTLAAPGFGGYAGAASAGGGRGRGGAASTYGGHTRGLGSGVADETRMMTSSTPLARARMRATGVIGQLKRLLTEKAGFDPRQAVAPSPALAEAISQHAGAVASRMQTQAAGHDTVGEVVVYDDAAVEQAVADLRQRSGELKKKAATTSEKATIEIVALMFQAILAEERIPPGVRVWFARLQMPVLRLALAEPEFFGTLEHPARLLIDRMGSCVLGFNAATIGGSALEAEIKRVVQVIEQYPETGRRVFQLVYDEFQKFLARFLTEKSDTQRLVSIAQQVEQKEAMAIQYTIELRKMLADVPVREEIREFLFKVWAEVLAVAAVRHGPQHADTVALKKSAAELVWSASAKPNKAERTKVIQELPALLQRLRQGMGLMGLDAAQQEKHIKVISDTLADAFRSKTEAIPQGQIDAIGKRLAHLEDFISDDPSADLPLDQEALEMMLGIDASMIEVVAGGGSRPNDAMLAWAAELQQGTWFTLDHNGQVHQVQYVWRSQRNQLHLFASSDGRSFLLQMRRLGAYLQAGLLLPAEEEALTVRATREALARLDANPERLLA
ncbi:DUF1631 family protein [Ramlibacter tataouinensis]|uniref:DUF1631 family protein n=1 Tax=Ramlibacter tataouinensis TaxID=94132 RepID=UPI0022F3AA81|nr:DUF1631 family protein [Ramlibacter tataouinensis]WBY00140.1 DUF1631 family protein [Ramlibacter tataouinensis]